MLRSAIPIRFKRTKGALIQSEVMIMRYYMGIDGGGTKTVCLLSEENGTIIGTGVAGPSNYHVVGIDQTQTAIHTCINEAIAQSGRRIIEIQGITLGMAGIDRPEDHQLINRILKALTIEFRYINTENDAAIALAGATVGRPGIVIISGTGSICFGINSRGQRARAGGWGPILGDEGSGYDIGRRAMIAALRDNDGRGPTTILKEILLEHLKLPVIESLVKLVHEHNMPRHEIASLARLVVSAADKGDYVAQAILTYAGQELATGATTVIRKLNMELGQFDICLAGGTFRDKGLIDLTIRQRMAEVAPLAKVISSCFEPVVGALLLSLRLTDNGLTPKIIETIKKAVQKGCRPWN